MKKCVTRKALAEYKLKNDDASRKRKWSCRKE
jgi:hypothetical protein